MKSRLARHLFPYALGAAVLAYVVGRNWSPADSGGPTLADALAGPVQPGPLILAGAFCLVGLLLMFVRWYVLVRAQELPFTMSDALRLGSIGLFLGTFLPGSVAGDVAKAALLAREQKRRAVAVATVLMDRAVGFWGLFWLVTLVGGTAWLVGDSVLAAADGLRPIIGGAAAVVAVSLGAWGLLGALPERRAERITARLEGIPRLGRTAAELWRAVWLYRRRSGSIGAALLLSLASQACFVLAFVSAAHVFPVAAAGGSVPSLGEHFILVPVGETVQAFFPAPGGVGGTEYTYGKLYQLTGSREPSGVLAALAYRVVLWSWCVVGYAACVWINPADRPESPPTYARPPRLKNPQRPIRGQRG